MKKGILYLCSALLLLSCNKSKEPDHPTANTILFYRDNSDGRSNDLYSISETGTGEKRITTLGATHSEFLGSPSWGPDHKIYFHSRHETPGHHIYSMNADGSGVTRITSASNNYYGYAAASISGRRLLYQSQDLGLQTCALDGSDVKRVTTTASWDPSWHPDGRRVVYAPFPALVNNILENQIFITNYDGTSTQQVSRGGGRVYRDPFVSPDGARIAYTVGSKVYVSNMDGTGEVAISHLAGVDGSSKGWTPDGQWVLVEGYDTYTLNLVKADGTSARRIGASSQKFIDPSIR